MAHNLGERQLRARLLEFARDEILAEHRRDALDRGWALLAVKIFNARLASGREMVLSPTVGAALACHHHWLHVLCPACLTVGVIDLRVVRRPADMPVTEILASLRCRFCDGNNAKPSIIKLSDLHSN